MSSLNPPAGEAEVPAAAGSSSLEFKRHLYEALLVSYGKILAKYDAFSQASILRDVGKEIIDYLNRHDFKFTETGQEADLATLTELFVKNGFVGTLEVQPANPGNNYIWHDLYGVDAYRELHEISDNPFLACPLNLCLYYLADKHGKSMRLLKKSFDTKDGTVESQYEVVEKEPLQSGAVDPLVIENARLYQIACDRADRLEKAHNEIHRLRGILPICSSCKKIRDEKGNWQQLEVYISDRSNADFSHGLCPICAEEFMASMAQTLPSPEPRKSPVAQRTVVPQ